MKQLHHWIELLGDALKQLGELLQGSRPVLQPIPIRDRSEPPAPPPY